MCRCNQDQLPPTFAAQRRSPYGGLPQPAYVQLEEFTPFLGEAEILFAHGGLNRDQAEVAMENFIGLPPSAPQLPLISKMRSDLRAAKTTEANALEFIFSKVGTREFGGALIGSLHRVPWLSEGGTRFPVQLAWLGVEAFLKGILVPEEKRFQIGFIQHPSQLKDAGPIAQRAHFIHFAIRRLHDALATALKPAERRTHMDRLAPLFSTLQLEFMLARRFVNFTNLAPDLLADYRCTAVFIFWTHYQHLMDEQLLRAGKSKRDFEQAMAAITADYNKAVFTNVGDDKAFAPAYRSTATVYRDFFSPAARTDIAFRFFNTSAKGPPPEYPMSFRTILRRRLDQIENLGALDGKPVTPPPPAKLHDSASWQKWLRAKWDGELRWQPTPDRLSTCLKVASAYFEAFTTHVPLDLTEGCAVPNYLTRAFPRSITGALIHDCTVYALRWIHMLGGLLDAKKLPEGIKSFRIFLVEMPAHVGVVVRLTLLLDKPVAILINNKEGQLRELPAGTDDDQVQEMLVRDMYPGMKVVYRPILLKSAAGSAAALWAEVCKIASSLLTLPFPSSGQPHLNYLEHHAEVARISRGVLEASSSLWLERFPQVAAGTEQKARPQDIRRYMEAVQIEVTAGTKAFEKDVVPIIRAIALNLAGSESKIPKGARIVETARRPQHFWEEAWGRYRPALERAAASGNLTRLDPRLYFSDDDFDASVQ